MTAGVKFVAWTGPQGRATRAHIRDDHTTTLCGRSINGARQVPCKGLKLCETCAAVLRAWS